MIRLLATAAVAATVLVAAPCLAASRSYTDPAGDSGKATDLRAVTVSYDARLRVTATYPGSSLKKSVLRYWLDTLPHNHGPEFLVVVVPNSDGSGILAIDDWGQIRGDPVDCAGFGAHADVFATRHKTWVGLPPSCIGAPHKVSVALQSRRGKSSDWVKDTRTYLPPVKHS